MKILQIISIFMMLFISISCEEVVEVDLEESQPRLVIEASLVWDINLQEETLFIKISKTAPFFEEEIPPVKEATVKVFSEKGEVYEFTQTEPGFYVHPGFPPQIGVDYTLEVVYNGEIYEATEKFVPTVELEDVTQDNEGGFSGNDIELKVFYTDPAGVQNNYLFRYFSNQISLQIYDDELTDGNRNFAFFTDEDLKAGDRVIFEIQGISRPFYEYLFLLRSQAGGDNAGPFQTQPTTVKGNIVNTTDPENFPFGFFRLSSSDFLEYVVQ